ncbi:hypothetical protein H072_7254 [Dactylellina haptotyla CBS 200.50]|uniref:RRM domain-containing protein n=1 Tax=Dactylellina haptotyla (strain CBS 200.50) TaxID=1284197 RepID=S8A7Z5_DACHA|nr:hypothetical protein H072_7254 [Dactylellina haptotyla CBS 200.50]
MQQTIEALPPKPNGGRRIPSGGKEPYNEKLMVHVGGIPPMMPEEVVKQAATQFGAVKDFFKVNRHSEKAYEYAPCFGFLTFEDEVSVTRALNAGAVSIGDIRLQVSPFTLEVNIRSNIKCDVAISTHVALVGQAAVLPERPPPARNQAPFHAKRYSNSSQYDNKGPSCGPQRGTRPMSSTCTVYGLPDSFSNKDLTERGNEYGRVINAHIFEYKDRESRRFGTLNFDSTVGAEQFYKKENGQIWNGCGIKITFEPFNVAKRNNAPPFRPGGNSGSHGFQRNDQRPYDGQRRYQNSSRGPRYPPNAQGRFNQRGGFPHNGNFQNPPHQSFPIQAHYPQEQQQYYDPQMIGYPQYHPQYPPLMNHPSQMVAQQQYGPVGVVSPPMSYGHPVNIPENTQPLSSPPQRQQQQAQPVEQPLYEEIVPITVPETKDPEDPSNIFIKNIDDDVIYKPEHLEAQCKKFGDIVSISMPTYENGLIKGFAFVKFTTTEAALKAKESLHLTIVGRKRLFVSFAEDRDHRQTRLANFYNQNGNEVKKSPDSQIIEKKSPDPLLMKNSPEGLLEKNDDTTSEKLVSNKQEAASTVTVVANSDATSETPAEKEKDNAKENGTVKEESTDTAGANTAGILTPTPEIDNTTATTQNSEPTKAILPIEQEGSKSQARNDTKFVKPKKLSVEELMDRDPSIQAIRRKGKDRVTDNLKGRKLSAEELIKLDPAIKSVGRPMSTTGFAITSSGKLSPATASTPGSPRDPLKPDGLKQLLHGLQNNDLNTNPSGSSSCGEFPKKKGETISTTRIEGRAGSNSENDQQNRVRDELLKALGQPIIGEASIENTDDNKAVEVQEIPRGGTRNSNSSTGSRVSRTEFSEALKGKFGEKIPSIIRSADVLDAVDKYVESRNSTREPSPNEKSGATKVSKEKEPKVAAQDTSNIVAPVPSRKVSMRDIDPSNVANEDSTTTQRSKVELGKQEVTQNPLAVKETVQSIPSNQPGNNPSTISNGVEQSAVVEYSQNVPVLSTGDQKARYMDKARAGTMKRSGSQHRPHYGNNNSVQKYTRSNINHGHGSHQGGTLSPTHTNCQRGPEQSPHQVEHFHPHPSMNFPNFPPHLSHPHTMICEGPCNQPQCQGQFPRFPPPEMHQGIFPGQMPGYDPTMFHHSGPYYGMDPRFPPPPPPHIFNGPPPIYPPHPQWGPNGSGHPSMPPHPQGSFSMFPPGPRYSPPGPNTPPHLAGIEQGGQNRGFYDYPQYPPQHYINPMHYEQAQGMPTTPQQHYHGQGQYRSPQGAGSVPTF